MVTNDLEWRLVFLNGVRNLRGWNVYQLQWSGDYITMRWRFIKSHEQRCWSFRVRLGKYIAY